MTITKSQKIWIGLLGVGLGALAVDQIVGQDSSAMATAINTISTLTGSDSPSDPAKGEAQRLNPSDLFAARLRTLADTTKPFETLRDAFAPVRTIAEPAAVLNEVAAAVKDDAAQQFSRRHTLRGIVRTGGMSQAWVDGRLIAVGQRLGEARLVSAEGMTAVFDLNGVRTTLSLPDATPSALANAGSPTE